MRTRFSGTLSILVSLAAIVLTDVAAAQSRNSHIEKVANQRLSGSSYATVKGISFEDCETRCIGDSRCVAIEHFRGGGRVIGRASQCKLFSQFGETRANQYADVGYKRPGAGPPRKDKETAEAKKKEDAKAARPAEVKPAEPAPDLAGRPGEVAAQVSTPAEAERRRLAEQAQREAEQRAERQLAERQRSLQSAGNSRSAAPAPSPSNPSGGAAPPAAAARPAPPAPPAPVASQPAPAQPLPQPPPVVVGQAPSAQPSSSPPAPKARSIVRGGGETAAAAPPPTDWDLVPVYYGTDRNRRDQPKRIAYGSDRARRLELGRAMVTVPKSHQVPNVERPWAVKIPYIDVTLYSETEDPKKHFTIKEITALSREEMLKLVGERLAAAKSFKDQALVVIHGYNNGFDDALYRTAQITYDLKFDGAPFLYSWPSGAGITSYPYDRESAQQAEQYLTQFLETVLGGTGAKQVSIIAHSMGNQTLLQVLKDMRQSPNASRINQIILAAPDVDRDNFEYLASQIRGVGRGITMYVSSNDVALGVSRRFAGGVPRAGDVPVDLGPVVVAGVDTIDVSALSTDYIALNHSSYAEKTPLLQDIELVLKTGQRPPESRLPALMRVVVDKGVYWRYPK